MGEMFSMNKQLKKIVTGIIICLGFGFLMQTSTQAANALQRQTFTWVNNLEVGFQVNGGVPLELFAFFDDATIPGGAGLPAMCLYDLAFLFRDTPSRFSLRDTYGTNLDFWIERGRHLIYG